MRIPITLSSLVALVIASASVAAQERPIATTAQASRAEMPADCSAGKKRHDHGAERNVPSALSMACSTSARASTAKAKSKPAHDHAKIHKNQ